jgi:hypothetical protein
VLLFGPVVWIMDPNGPALAPPDGVDSNFDNPSNGNTLVITVLSVSLTISSLFLLIRGLAKGVYLKRLQFEDCRCSRSNSLQR